MTSVPPTPIERSAAAGSDRKDIPPNPVSAPPSNVAPPVGRNVTGSDNKVRPRPARRPEDSDEQESVFSKESEKRSHTRSKRHMSPGKTSYTLEPVNDLKSKLGIQSKVQF